MSWNTRILHFKMMTKYRFEQFGGYLLNLLMFICVTFVVFVISLCLYLGYIALEDAALLWYFENYCDFEQDFTNSPWTQWLYLRYAFRAAKLKFRYSKGEKACLKEIMIFIFTKREKIRVNNRATVILDYLIGLQRKYKINIVKRDKEFSQAYKDLYEILRKFRDSKKK